MAWLWPSWPAFVEYVHPQTIQSATQWRLARNSTFFELHRRLVDSVNSINMALVTLRALGFRGEGGTHLESAVIEAEEPWRDMLGAGEELLLLHRRLAVTDAAYGFLHSLEALEANKKRATTRSTARIIDQAVADVGELLTGYQALATSDDELFSQDVDLPIDLCGDFALARNLISVGFDEIAVLIAGRGLEGVLRSAAARRRIVIATRQRKEPATNADFHDLIEAMYRARWRVGQERLISGEMRSLLQYLRTVRNRHAHTSGATREVSNPRETTILLARAASQLWTQITATTARLETTVITKSW